MLFVLPGLVCDRDFWVEDEARYAEVVREMMADGQWMAPHLNGFIYPDKPPLYFWSACLLVGLLGCTTPLAFLLLSALPAFGLMIITYAFGNQLQGAATGFYSALVLISSLLFMAAAQIVRMDMLFSFWIGASFYSFYMGVAQERPWFFSLSHMLCALAVLTKGPLAMAFTILPMVTFLVLTRRGKVLKQWLTSPGALVLILLVGGWLILAWKSGFHALVADIFEKQLLARSVYAFQHREPLYYYLLVLPLASIPWFPYLFWVRPKQITAQPNDGFMALLLLWLVGGLAVISLLSGKLFIYLLPLTPPLAIILGNRLATLEMGHHKSRSVAPIAALASVLSLPGAMLLLPRTTRLYPGGRLDGIGWITAGFAILLIGLLWAVHRRQKNLIAIGTLVSSLFLSWTIFLIVVPQANDFYSSKKLGQEIRAYAENGYRVAGFRITRGILSFYAGQKIEELTPAQLDRYLDPALPGKRLLAIKTRHLKQLPEFTREAIAIQLTQRINNETYLLVTLKSTIPE